VAQAIAPETRVVYVDNDPLVLAHARALLTSRPEGVCECVDADLRDPKTILEEAAQTLDFSRPIAVVLVAVLHFIPDADDPQGIVAELAAGLVPGSFIAISHLTADAAPDEVGAGVSTYNALVPTGLTARSHAEVTGLFGGLRLGGAGGGPGQRVAVRSCPAARRQRRCVCRGGQGQQAVSVSATPPQTSGGWA
jgi:hypothetical protein